MRHLKYLIFFTFLLTLNSCMPHNFKPKNVGVLPGTDTVVVGIPLDPKGYPVHTVGRIDLKVGQKIIFAGPEKFSIFFKNGISPFNEIDFRSLAGLNRDGLKQNRVELNSIEGVVTVSIPKDLFERPENRGKPYIDYFYGISVNGLEIDPPARVHPN